MTFRIAHFSDPHIGPLSGVRKRDLASKRITGYFNYRTNRKATHDMDVLARLIDDLEAQGADHICCTGDVANIGLMSEFKAAESFLETIGGPDRVTFVPGNHDVYVRGSHKPMRKHLGRWMTSTGAAETRFPFVKRFGEVALVGLSSAIPTMPFLASGRIGERQLAEAEQLLTTLGAERCCRVILIHHPPYKGGAKPGRALTDARDFEKMLKRVGAELVLHGHNHVPSLVHLPGRDGRVPVLGAPSASACGGTPDHLAGYFLIDIEQRDQGCGVNIFSRRLQEDGTFGPVAGP